MNNSQQSENNHSPLKSTMARLAELRQELNSSRYEPEGIRMSRDEIARRLDELDMWIDDLIGFLGDRRQTRTETPFQKE
jgi:hypothetical protein